MRATGGGGEVPVPACELFSRTEILGRLGVDLRRIYIDHGLTGKNRERPGLREALAACHEGSTLVVTKLHRLGRSITDLRDIAHELEERGVLLSLDGQVYDPTTPFGRLVFKVFAMMAEFEGDLISQRTIEGYGPGKGPRPAERETAEAVREARCSPTEDLRQRRSERRRALSPTNLKRWGDRR